MEKEINKIKTEIYVMKTKRVSSFARGEFDTDEELKIASCEARRLKAKYRYEKKKAKKELEK